MPLDHYVAELATCGAQVVALGGPLVGPLENELAKRGRSKVARRRNLSAKLESAVGPVALFETNLRIKKSTDLSYNKADHTVRCLPG